MTNKEGYNYDEFLEDSSDDYPRHPMSDREDEDFLNSIKDNNPSKCSKIIIHPNDDETNYKEAYEDKENLKIALHNVLELAAEQLNAHYSKDCVEANKIIAQQSIDIVRKYMDSIQDSNIILAQQDNNNL